MTYLCLGYYDPDRFDALSPQEQEALGRDCAPMDRELNATGRVLSVASLAHRTAVTLRPEPGGRTRVTDGPFSEAKEVVGSYFLIEADSLDEAVRVASLHPAARWGAELGWAVEVRPIDVCRVKEPAA